MGVLGVPFRVVYQATNNLSGLTDVIAYVLKPDGNLAGPYSMPELVFNGTYGFNFLATTSDPEGEYIAKIISPTEGKSAFKAMSIYRLQQAPPGLTNSIDLIGYVEDDEVVQGFVEDDEDTTIGEVVE